MDGEHLFKDQLGGHDGPQGHYEKCAPAGSDGSLRRGIADVAGTMDQRGWEIYDFGLQRGEQPGLGGHD